MNDIPIPASQEEVGWYYGRACHFAGLQRGETFFGRQRGIFYFAVITENGSGDAPGERQHRYR